MARRRFLIIFWLMIGAVFLRPSQVAALSRPFSIAELARQSDDIVHGRVMGLSAQWTDPQRGLIETVAMLSIHETLKGAAFDSALLVHTPGGRIGDLTMIVSDQPVLRPGEDVLLFLTRQPGGEPGVFGGDQGAYVIVGQMAYNTAGQRSLPLGDLRQQIGQALREPVGGQDGAGAPFVIGTRAPDWRTFAGLKPVDYVYSGQKWFGPNPMEEPYRVNLNANDIGATNGTSADFRNAIINAGATWNGVSSADFNFSYGGSTTISATQYDGINAVFWADMGAGGALATSTWWFDLSGRILEADLAFNDYFAWDATGAPSLAEPDVHSVALHELGHWLSLDHDTDPACSSCSVAGPVMCYCYTLGTLRRTLSNNDRAGISFVYPAATPTATPTSTATPTATRTATPTPTPAGGSTSTPTPTVTAARASISGVVWMDLDVSGTPSSGELGLVQIEGRPFGDPRQIAGTRSGGNTLPAISSGAGRGAPTWLPLMLRY